MCVVCTLTQIYNVPLQVQHTIYIYHEGPKIGGVYFSQVQLCEYQEVSMGIYSSQNNHVEKHLKLI